MSSPRLLDEEIDYQQTKYHDLDSLPPPSQFQHASSKAKRIGQNVSEKAKLFQQKSFGFYGHPDPSQRALLEESKLNEEVNEPEVPAPSKGGSILRRSREFFGRLSGEKETGSNSGRTVKLKP